jgi:hypothetical protein
MASKNTKSAVKVSKAQDKAASAKREARNKTRRDARAAKKTLAQLPFTIGDRVTHPKHGSGTISYCSMQHGVSFMDVLSDKGGTLQVASKGWTKVLAKQIWAVGTQVEHPAHGRGFVCGHTQTDGVIEVNFDLESAAEVTDARGIGVEGIEVHQDELKLVTEPKPHKPHTDKKFNFPKRKHADKAKKQNAAEEIGTAQEQHAAYAKRARDYSMNDRVVELNGRKREGNVFTVAREGSGYMDVLFDGETVACAKFVADLRKVNMKGHKIAIGDLVAFKKTPTKLLGTVERARFQDGTCRVKIDQWVSKETRLDNLKLWVAPKVKEETTKFENLPLLSGFEYKGDSHIKVGNTSAIVTPIDRETNGGAGATIPMIRLPEFGVESSHTKVRLKKDTRVKPIVSVPFGAESREA